MTTREKLLAQLEEARQRAADAARDEADATKAALAARQMRQQWEGMASFLEGQLATQEGLQPAGHHATLATMLHATETRGTRVSRARLKPESAKHAAVKAFAAAGDTVKVAAGKLGYPRSTVQSWYDEDEANRRPIPRVAADRAKKLYGIPLSAWWRVRD